MMGTDSPLVAVSLWEPTVGSMEQHLTGGNPRERSSKSDQSGTIDTLYSFTGQEGTTCTASDKPDGGDPYAPPVQGTSGYYYGITSLGTSYRISSSGDFKALCSLVSPSVPIPFGALSPVVQATDGYFYGTSSSESGAVFRFSPAGVAKIVHTFIPSEGSAPNGPVLQASDGNLYGTTASGGPLGSGSGVIYKLTLGGKLTVTHAFDRIRKFAEGYRANAGLLEATDGFLYGSTQYGGDPGLRARRKWMRGPFQNHQVRELHRPPYIPFRGTCSTSSYTNPAHERKDIRTTERAKFFRWRGDLQSRCWSEAVRKIDDAIGQSRSEGTASRTIPCGSNKSEVWHRLRQLRGGQRQVPDSVGTSSRDDWISYRDHSVWNADQQQ